jgi:hypothetical protein
MTNKISLGVISNNLKVDNSNIAMLINKFNIVNDPYIFNENFNIIKNHDITFLCDSHEAEYTLKHLNIPKIGCDRYDKFLQQQILRNNGFNVPDFYSQFYYEKFSNKRHDFYHPLLDNLNENDEIIIKSQSGARGLGQILTTKKELYNILDNYNDLEFIKTLNIGGSEKDSEESVKHVNIMLNNSEYFFISKKLNIINEYRLMVFFGETPVVMKRNLDPTKWQGNISVTNNYEIIDYKKVFNEDFNNKTQNFLKTLNTPWLSMDLYEDSNNNLGFFEFQMQYAYKGFNTSELIEKTNNSVMNILKYNKFI